MTTRKADTGKVKGNRDKGWTGVDIGKDPGNQRRNTPARNESTR